MSTHKRARLTDILTREVSLVDKAANKRRFVLTKADGAEMSTELVPDGKGGFALPVPSAPARPALVEAIEKLTALANAPAPAGGEEEIAKAVSAVVEGLYLQPLPAAFAPLEKADMGAIQGLVAAAVAKLNELGAALAIPAADMHSAYSIRWQVASALDGLVAITEMGSRAEVAKSDAGADVAALVAETLTPVPAVATAAAPNPDIEKYRALAKALHITLDSCKGIADDTHVTDTTFDPAAASRLLDESTKVIKSLQQRVVTLEGVVVTPNALPVERVTKSSPTPEAWPSDMARPDSDFSF